MVFDRCYGCMGELSTPGGICRHCGYDNTKDMSRQPEHALPCGTVLAGHYVVGRVLGQGGFGISYIGWDLNLELKVCLKEYYPDGAAMRSSSQSRQVYWGASENAQSLKAGRESFVREARKAVKLRDLSHVVSVWGVFFENETAYIAMDYAEGETLRTRLMRDGPLTEKRCLQLLEPVIRDLEQVHARGIIHRDIKPDNLMVTPEDELMLLDLGAAKDLSHGSGQSSYMVASQGFSPLEQYKAHGEIGPWTDVYAMCATIYYCVTGKVLPAPVDRLGNDTLDVSVFTPAVGEVLKKGLALQAQERIRDMGTLAEALRAAVTPPAPKPKKKSRLPVILAAVLGAGVLFYGGMKFAAMQSPAMPAPAETAAPVMEMSAPSAETTTEVKSTPTPTPTSTPKSTPTPKATPETEEAAYERADKLYNQGKYEEAIEAFRALGGYRDSAARIETVKAAMLARDYAAAEALVAAGRFTEAADAFKALGDYRDSQARSGEMGFERDYAAADALLAQGQYDEASLAFQALNNDSVSAARREQAIRARDYAAARALLHEGNYEKAIDAFSSMADYRDSAEQLTAAQEALYASAKGMFDAWHYEDAARVFESLGDYKDSAEQHSECLYREAEALLEAGDKVGAARLFYSIKDYKDASERVNALRPGAGTIAAGNTHTVAVRSDGTVAAAGANTYKQCNVSAWTDIVSVAAGTSHTVGLKADGTVFAVGLDMSGRLDVEDWRDIVAIAAGPYSTVGLRADGTVAAVGRNDHGQCNTSGWTDIVAVTAGTFHTVGLKSDGSVVAAGLNLYRQCNVDGWSDIVAVAAGTYHTVGLKSDGTVVAVGDNSYGQCNVSDWTDIVAIAAGATHTLGLRADGTVLAVGSNGSGQCQVDSWRDITAIAAGQYNTLGLKADGTLLVIGRNNYKQCSLPELLDPEKAALFGKDAAQIYLGITAQDVSATLKQYGMPAGADVISVAEDSTAAEAGIHQSDIITSVNGKTVKGNNDLVKIVQASSPGEKLTMQVYRQHTTITLSVAVGDAKAD